MYDKLSVTELDALRESMRHNGMSFYGGSDLDAYESQATYALHEKVIANGFTVRHEPGKVVLVINPDSTLPASASWDVGGGG
jgi:hypothetical protein